MNLGLRARPNYGVALARRLTGDKLDLSVATLITVSDINYHQPLSCTARVDDANFAVERQNEKLKGNLSLGCSCGGGIHVTLTQRYIL